MMNIIYECTTGSRAYGTDTETSDIDTRAIGVPTASALHGFLTEEPSRYNYSKPVDDYVAYDIRQFFRLATKGAFNVLELLYVPFDLVRVCSQLGHDLRDARGSFLSLQLFDHAALGLAYNAIANPTQLKSAMHAVRVLRMATEALTTGALQVRRPDADFLRSIREGAFGTDVSGLLAQEFEAAKVARADTRRIVLPERVNTAALNALCIRLVEDAL